MKKTVLFLMNGFGVEQVDSYSIYSDALMPNLASYIKDYLFSPIESKYINMDDGFLGFSTGSKLPLSYTLMDRVYNDYSTSKNFNFFIQNIKQDGRLHLFCYVESDRILEHLKSFVSFITSKVQIPIFIHCILTSEDIENYKEIEKVISRIHYDFNNCKVATIIGERNINNINLTSYMNMLQNEIGEKWKELSKKITSLHNSKIPPRDSLEFIMNEGFKIEKNDTMFFFNYRYTALDNFITNISKVVDTSKTFSLFPIKGIKYPMLAFPKSGISSLNSLKKINSNALVATTSNRINKINYYLTGLQQVIPDRISYVRTDNNALENIDYLKAILDDNFNLVIVEYSIDDVKDIPELKDRLSKLDGILKNTVDYCKDKNYTLFISSLYGIKKELPLDNYTKYIVNFSSKVPFIVVDEVFNKEKFRIDVGDTYNLAHTTYTSVNNKYAQGSVLIKKKGFKFK